MPRKSLYVSEEDESVWERAESLADVSLSKLVADLLRKEVSKMEAYSTLGKQFREITIELNSYGHPSEKKMFIGKWIADYNDPDSFHWDKVALTRKNQILVHHGDNTGTFYTLYKDLDELLRDEHQIVIHANKVEAAKALGGEFIEFLDI
jgi:hypothetical protein